MKKPFMIGAIGEVDYNAIAESGQKVASSVFDFLKSRQQPATAVQPYQPAPQSAGFDFNAVRPFLLLGGAALAIYLLTRKGDAK